MAALNPSRSGERRRYILVHRKGLGDVVLMTALVRDIHLAYGGRVQVDVRTTAGNLWEYNPHITKLNRKSQGVRTLQISYKAGLARAQRGGREHFLCAYYDDFERKTGLHVPMTRAGGDLHLSEEECEPWIEGPYWVVIAGGYNNITTKQWPYSRYQEAVDRLSEQGIRFVQAGSTDAGHVHPPLRGVLSLVGKTDHRRDFLSLIYHSQGVVCGITGAMHIAAAFDKPCVVLGGARESQAFVAYDHEAVFRPECPPVAVPHVYLHSLGQLACGPEKGCWKKRTVPIEARDYAQDFHRLCRQPVERPDGWFPACMELVSTDAVVDAVMSYYRNGTLPMSDLRTPDIVSYRGEDPVRLPEQLRLTRAPRREKPPRLANLAQPRPLSRAEERRDRQNQALFDHPYIGGRITVCALCYGEHPDLAQRCISSIVQTVPPGRLDLRLAGNAVGPATRSVLQAAPATKLYLNEENLRRYPAMRQMWHDPECPLTTPYVVWFDDDSYVLDPNWVYRLLETITRHHNRGARLYGSPVYHDLRLELRPDHRPDRWFRESPWFSDRCLRDRFGRVIPNGSCLHTVSPGFFAIGTDAIRQAGIPDERLGQTGGHVVLGAQLASAGFTIQAFNETAKYVCVFSRPGRGVAERVPW